MSPHQHATIILKGLVELEDKYPDILEHMIANNPTIPMEYPDHTLLIVFEAESLTTPPSIAIIPLER